MSIMDDLHTLVDRLDEDEAVVALSYLREIPGAEGTVSAPRRTSLGVRKGPPSVSGKAFFAEKPRPDVMELAREQSVLPLCGFDDLLGDFWPEDESAGEFVEAIRQLRRDGGHG